MVAYKLATVIRGNTQERVFSSWRDAYNSFYQKQLFYKPDYVEKPRKEGDTVRAWTKSTSKEETRYVFEMTLEAVNLSE